MINQRGNLKTASVDDLDLVGDIPAGAFESDPCAELPIPDGAVCRRTFPVYFRLPAQQAIQSGYAYLRRDGAAASTWFYPLDGPSPPAREFESRLYEISGDHAQRVIVLDAALLWNHPRDAEHDHVALLGVRPGRQGRGIGAAMLRGHLAVSDIARARPNHVAAPTDRSRNFDIRHGYRPRTPFSWAHGGFPVWPMMRPVQAKGGRP